MTWFSHPKKPEVSHFAEGSLAVQYELRGWAQLSDDEQAAVDLAVATETPLRGRALDDALRKAGLPTTGRADDKRDRLVEHLTGVNTTAVLVPE